MPRRAIIVAAVTGILLISCGCINIDTLGRGRLERIVVEESPRWFELNRIALIDIDGFIGSDPGLRLFQSGTTLADVKEKLEWAASDSRVRAVVLRINSPGGEVTASDMVHREIVQFKKETGKPVVAVLMGLAASGGYYVASAADYIVAAPTSVTGSVGVIMQYVNVQGLFGKVGLQPEVVKSGDKKDIASATRAMTPDERRILQDINEDLFERFKDVVRLGRPDMTDENLAVIADGRIVTGAQAVDLHMADRLGYLDDGFAEARRLAGIGGADVVLYRAFPHYNANIYALRETRPGMLEQGLELLLHQHGAAFLYLWSPGLGSLAP